MSVRNHKLCWATGNDRLQFVLAAASFVSADVNGQENVLMVWSRSAEEWDLLAITRDLHEDPFSSAIRLAELLDSRSSGVVPEPPTLVSPPGGEPAVPAAGETHGYLVWAPSPSQGVVAEIVEVGYPGESRLFLIPHGEGPSRLSTGSLYTAYELILWRVWSVHESGLVSISEARSFFND